MNTLQVTVFGAGSIGCYVGGQLAHAGIDVRFIGRQRFQQALRSRGLTLTHFDRKPIVVSPNAFSFDTELSDADVDVVLVCVKSQDTQQAGIALCTALREDTLVISLQNGASNADVLRAAMPGFTVLAGMVPFNVTGTGPGAFHCGTQGDLCIEQHNDERLATLRSGFERSGQGCLLSESIDAVLWGKLLVNLNNAMNTLFGGPLKAGLLQRDYRRALSAMIEEALGIVRAAGIQPERFGGASPDMMIRILRLPNVIYRVVMNLVVKIDANARSSMLDDLEAGRPSEVDYLQGEIVRLAASLQRSAPINSTVLSLVEQAFVAGKSPRLMGADIWRVIQSPN
ncbi:MAG: 2-dehydropantoate 2-reductase [Pseudomonadota bacterium]